jgi:MFS family permease
MTDKTLPGMIRPMDSFSDPRRAATTANADSGQARATAPRQGPPPQPSQGHAAVAGLICLLIGLGFSRFGYPPLIPALVHAGWFDAAQAAYLGAANLAGYLLGAALGPPAARRLPAVPLIRGSLVACTAALIGCALPWGFAWYFAWRVAAGVAGAILMVVAAPVVIGHAPPGRRGRVGGWVFTGVGIGVVLTGTLIPWLVGFGVAEAWLALGAASAGLTALAWRGLPHGAPLPERPPAPPAATRGAHASGPRIPIGLPLAVLAVTYSAYAVGFVPHTVFWVDFIARGLGQGLAAGGSYWVLLGVAACLGPALTGAASDRIGFGMSYRLGLLAIAGSVGLPLLSTAPWALAVSSAGVGALSISIASLALGRVSELAPLHRQRQAWGWITIAFSVFYAAGGYALSYLFARTGDYRPVFAVGAAALVFGFLLDWAAALLRRGALPRTPLGSKAPDPY